MSSPRFLSVLRYSALRSILSVPRLVARRKGAPTLIAFSNAPDTTLDNFQRTCPRAPPPKSRRGSEADSVEGRLGRRARGITPCPLRQGRLPAGLRGRQIAAFRIP